TVKLQCYEREAVAIEHKRGGSGRLGIGPEQKRRPHAGSRGIKRDGELDRIGKPVGRAGILQANGTAVGGTHRVQGGLRVASGSLKSWNRLSTVCQPADRKLAFAECQNPQTRPLKLRHFPHIPGTAFRALIRTNEQPSGGSYETRFRAFHRRVAGLDYG